MQTFPMPPKRLKFERMKEDVLFRSEKLLDTFPIHSINLLIPSSHFDRQPLETTLTSDENVYFIVKEVTAKCLIEKAFLQTFVRAGSLLATSYKARIEVENFLAIVPPGRLILSLERSISRCLALSKENPSKKKKRKKTFETIIIDVNYPEFLPGRKIYDFIAFELSKIEHIKFTLLLKWNPQGNICPQSLITYFSNQNIECLAYKPNHQYSSKLSVTAPELNFDVITENTIEDLLEWIGMEICGINYSTKDEEYVSKFFPPSPSVTLSRLHKCTFQGFYSKLEAIPLLREIRKLFHADSSPPFVVTCFNGFQDSYVAANGFQYFSSADKLICLITFPDSNYWIITLNVR